MFLPLLIPLAEQDRRDLEQDAFLLTAQLLWADLATSTD